jgi:hypothetical protein
MTSLAVGKNRSENQVAQIWGMLKGAEIPALARNEVFQIHTLMSNWILVTDDSVNSPEAVFLINPLTKLSDRNCMHLSQIAASTAQNHRDVFGEFCIPCANGASFHVCEICFSRIIYGEAGSTWLFCGRLVPPSTS